MTTHGHDYDQRNKHDALPIGVCRSEENRLVAGLERSYSPPSGSAAFQEHGGDRQEMAGNAGRIRKRFRQKKEQVMVEAQHRAKSMVENQKGKAASSLENMAQNFRQLSGEMRQKEMNAVSRYTEIAAERMEQVSGYIRDKDVNELIHEAEDMARRQPALFMGGAFMIGFLLARFLKASGRYSTARGSYGYPRYGYGTESYGYGGSSESFGYGEEADYRQGVRGRGHSMGSAPSAGGYRRNIPVREGT